MSRPGSARSKACADADLTRRIVQGHFNDSLSMLEIAESLEITEAEVEERLGKIGMTGRRIPSPGPSTARRMIRMYFDDEMTLEQIGNKFGITRQAVWQRMKKAGSPQCRRQGSRVSSAIIRVIDDMAAAGASTKAITSVINEQAGLSKSTAWNYSKDRRRDLRLQKIQRAIELYTIHKSTYKVGEILGVSDMTIWHWLRKAGVDTSDARNFSAEVKAKALRLCAKKSTKEVAEQIGCSVSTLDFWKLEADGIKRERTTWEKGRDYVVQRRRKAAVKMRKEARDRDRSAIAAAQKKAKAS